MDRIPDAYVPIIFPVAFAAFWVFVTNRLAQKAGWYALELQYPNRYETPVRRLRFQSGWLGSVSMSSILRLEACPSGLRVGILKLFGPFCRDFLVPWNEIKVERNRRLFWKVAVLDLGAGSGRLTLYDFTANQLARSVPEYWPEKMPFQPDTVLVAAMSAIKAWLIGMAFIGVFFVFVYSIQQGHQPQPFPWEAVLLFAGVFGIASFRIFLSRRAK